MLTKYQRESANRDLKAILKEYRNGYEIACKTSRAAFMETLNPGTKVPEAGRIYTEASKNAFDGMCAGYREKAKKVFDNLTNSLDTSMLEAPSTDAVNAISLFNMQKNASKGDVDRLLSKYGNNAQAYKTIVSIAHERKIISVAVSKQFVNVASRPARLSVINSTCLSMLQAPLC